MKIVKRQIMSLIIAVAVVVMGTLAGCGSGGSSLVGAWQLEDAVGISRELLAERVEYFSDGRASVDGVSVTWSTDGNRLMTVSPWGDANVYTFRISGSILTITYDDRGNAFSTYRRVR